MASLHEKVVQRYVKKYYPDADVVLLSGSAAEGRATAGSDLDVVIFADHLENSYRYIDKKYGRIFEIFLVSTKHYPFFLEEAKKSGIPSMVRMCMEGIIIVDHGQAAEIIAKAKDTWLEGPRPRTFGEIDQLRYEITEYMEDLMHSSNRSEDLFIMNRVIGLLVEFILCANHRWLGDGKWAYRALEQFDPAIAHEIVRVTDLFYQTGSRIEFADFVHRMLAPFGGGLRVGWMEGAALPEE